MKAKFNRQPTEDERAEFSQPARKGICCHDRMCGAEDCPNCHPENFSVTRPITPDDVIKEADRNYDLGRKHGKDELADVIAGFEKLYSLVEAYLCTPNTTPAVKDAYDNLVAWFVRNKRPDGSEPLPVSPEQECA